MRKLNNVLYWVVHGSHFVYAYQAVRQNKGAPGVDGLSVEDMKLYLPKHWEEVKRSILNGTYRPSSVRTVMLPKGKWRRTYAGDTDSAR